MTFETFIDHMRQEIREEGFMDNTKLLSRIALRSKYDFNVDFKTDDVLEAIPCDDVCIVEYCSWGTHKDTVKDLYVFKPKVII